jgi:hypothetical protein
LFLAALALAACDRRVEPYVAPADEPPKVDRPVRVPGLENPAPTARMPLGPPETAGARTGVPSGAASGEPIRGSISVADGGATSGAVLFLIARVPDTPGPPLAVKRLPVGPFPLEFEIGPADEMVQGRPWVGPIALSARVDRDGDPLTRDDADTSAELASPVAPGATGVELRLERGGAVQSPPAAASSEPIRGTISLADGGATSGAVLFLIARVPGTPGPPLAVKRLPVGPFPLEFEIGPEDVMIQGRPWVGPIALSARVDRDGDAMTRDSDTSAELAAPVAPGATGVELRLERSGSR